MGGGSKFFPLKNKFRFGRLHFAGIYTIIKFHSYDELCSSLFSTVKHQARNDFGFVCAMDDGWHAILRPFQQCFCHIRTIEG